MRRRRREEMRSSRAWSGLDATSKAAVSGRRTDRRHDAEGWEQAVNAEGTHPLPIESPGVKDSLHPRAPVRPASHPLVDLQLELPLCALEAPSSRCVSRGSLQSVVSPVPTAWARRTRERLSLSLRARCLSVAFRASDVVVHIQGARTVSPE